MGDATAGAALGFDQAAKQGGEIVGSRGIAAGICDIPSHARLNRRQR
jgi:hypothetical protein